MQPDHKALQRLCYQQQITDVLHRYCRGIDRMDQSLVRSCYHPDATDEHGSFSGGVEDYLRWCWKLLQRYDRTMHYLTNTLIDIEGDYAQAESYGVAIHEGDPRYPERNLTVGFRFIDVFQLRNDHWKISKRVATTEWTQINSADSRFAIAAGLRRGTRDQRDALYQAWGQHAPANSLVKTNQDGVSE